MVLAAWPCTQNSTTNSSVACVEEDLPQAGELQLQPQVGKGAHDSRERMANVAAIRWSPGGLLPLPIAYSCALAVATLLTMLSAALPAFPLFCSTFEFWLHPDRYKTSLCERGANCNRLICFFAHSEDELRPLPQGLQRTQPAHRAAVGSSAGAESSRAASSSRQQQYKPQTPSDNPLHVAAVGSQTQGGIQHSAERATVDRVQQPINYAPVVQQTSGIPYAAAIPGQQQHLLQQSVLRTGVVTGPTYMCMQPVASSGSQIGGHQQAPETSSEPTVAPGQHMPGPGLVRESQQHLQYGSSFAQPSGAVVHVPQQRYVQSQRAAEQPYQRPPVGQVVIGYHPVHGYSPPQGVVMVQQGLQHGGTVAVIPAGPSMWPQVAAGMSAETGEAPSLEDICAALAQLAVPPPAGPSTDLLMQQYANQGRGQPQEMMLLIGQQQAPQWTMQLQQQQQQPSFTQPL